MNKECLNACIRKLSFGEAKQLLATYTYALIYEISDIVLTEVEKLAEIDWENCKEAYFFDRKGQIHLYEDEENGEMMAVEFIPHDCNHVERKHALAGKYAKATGSKYVIIKEYLGTDEDGQTCVVYTALCDLE